MIVLNTSYSMTEVPYLTNDVLDRFAEKLIAIFHQIICILIFRLTLTVFWNSIYDLMLNIGI